MAHRIPHSPPRRRKGRDLDFTGASALRMPSAPARRPTRFLTPLVLGCGVAMAMLLDLSPF